VQTIEIEPTFESWQEAARALLREGVPPVQVRWREGREAHQPSLRAEPAPSDAVRVPRQFLELARQASAASDPARWQILYDTLWRLVHENRDLLKDARDPGVRRLQALLTPKGAPTETSAAPGEGAAPFVPVNAGLGELKAAAAHCQGCDLYHHATQTVFGRGSAEARIVFIGEQPGDQEDLQGAPFVGPAGEVFERALADAGLAREKLYVTNAVKHFKWEPRGKRRIHQKPNAAEIAACRPWLDAEIQAVKPRAIVCLGATAAQALLGRQFKVSVHRGEFVPSPLAPLVLATVHPSSILRAPDDDARRDEMRRFTDDLRVVADALKP